jgi:hypothetical protein
MRSTGPPLAQSTVLLWLAMPPVRALYRYSHHDREIAMLTRRTVRAAALRPASSLRRAALVVASASLLGPTLPKDAGAQYFGRNQVQYQTFDWRVARTEHFDIHFYPEQRQAAMDGARMAERWNARLQRAFGYELSERKPFIFYANHPDFQQTNVVGGPITEGVGGLTESARNRVVLPFTGVYADNDHVIGHELVHVYQYDIARGAGGHAAMGRLPLWVIEGMAEYLSIGHFHPHTTMWMRDAAMRDALPTSDQLTRDPRLFPYRYGHALWAFIAGSHGDSAVVSIYRSALRRGWDGAVREVLGFSADSLSQRWIAANRAMFAPQLAGRTRPQDIGDPILVSRRDRNISPSVSPDGNLVAFYSTRGLFNVDLFLANARTGEVITQLTDPNQDPHFEAISFIATAGAWSPDGERLAFVVFAEGRNEVVIWNVGNRRIEQQFAGIDVGAISTVAWSPDGTQLAYSGTRGGISNLYIRTLATGETRQLTDDRYAQIHPVWSPDGRSIAFATDRAPGTDFATLTYSRPRIAVLDVATGQQRLLPGFPGAKHINPQYSPDGNSVFFISDRGGVSDIYRIDLATDALYQVTNVATGVTGISELSPAISVARNTGRLMFSVFEDGREHIYALDAERVAGSAVTGPADVQEAGMLPPMQRRGLQIVTPYLADASTGLPPEQDFPERGYSRRLGLEYIGPPQLGFAADQFGTSLGGAVSFFFADMLGDRRAALGLQLQGSLRDFGAQAQFLNARRRLNWGGMVGRIPYAGGFVRSFEAEVDGQPAFVQERVIQRVYYDNAQAMAHYPFSTTQRLEMGLGATRVSYHMEAEQIIAIGNQIVDRRRVELPTPPGIGYGQGSLALVGDWSFFGFTAPMAGGRYRLEVSPTFGGLSFTSALLDYRRYLYARPFTLAVRGLHFGRYGAGSEDPRLNPLFVGANSLVRGYAAESFDLLTDCPTIQQTGCPAFERLVGSRLAVLNAEVRIPLFGPGTGVLGGGILPIDIAPFFDAGVAWTRAQEPTLRWGEGNEAARIPVFSAGLSSRVNLFGMFVLELFYARPFQRPGRGGIFGWQLAPGW